MMTKEDQDRIMEDAALRRMRERKANGKHVSCKYPEFEGYITPCAYGKTKEGDMDKDERFRRQIQALREARYASGGRPRRHDDGEDDDEEPPPTPKKQEGGIKGELSDIKEYVEPHQPRASRGASRGRARSHGKGESEDDDSEENSEEEDSDEEDSDADSENDIKDTIHVRHRGANTGAARHTNAEESDSGDEAAVPLVAVSRGLPVPEGAAMPALKAVNLKQRFATGIRCIE